MDKCPKCNAELNIDEKTSGRCFSCGAIFSSTIPKDNESSVSYILDRSNDNTVAKIIKVLGIIIIVLGTIGNIALIKEDNFSWVVFLGVELISLINGMFFVGLAEIIKMLEEIKNKK